MEDKLNVLIEGARVHDGRGFVEQPVRVGILGERVVFLDTEESAVAREVIDASGLILAPALIDVHNHADTRILSRIGANLLAQGVGTVIVGNCGFSPWGHLAQHPVFLDSDTNWDFANPGDYFQTLSLAKKSPIDVFSLAGLQSLLPMDGISERLDASIDSGCIGLSVGLNYDVQNEVTESDLIFLGRCLSKYRDVWGGICWHMRNQAEGLIESVREVVRVHEASGVPCHISHLKRAGVEKADEIDVVLDIIRPYPEISADMYTYVEGWTTLAFLIGAGRERLDQSASLEEAASAACRQFCPNLWDDVVLSSGVDDGYLGKSVREIAGMQGKEDLAAYLSLVSLYPDATACYMNQSHPSNVKKVLTFERGLVGSDGHIYDAGERGHHPRSFGTFARFFSLCRDENWMDLEAAIRKVTFSAAERFKLKDKGRVAPGLQADLCLLNPGKLRDNATFSQSNILSSGVERIFLRGRDVTVRTA